MEEKAEKIINQLTREHNSFLLLHLILPSPGKGITLDFAPRFILSVSVAQYYAQESSNMVSMA